MHIDTRRTFTELDGAAANFIAVAAPKVARWHRTWDVALGAPVFTRKGKYTARGWTEWTLGFYFGAPLLIFEATGDERFLALGCEGTLRHMAHYLTHTGVHDHGFNTMSTFGNLLRLARARRTNDTPETIRLYELAIKVSGAVQAARWTRLADGSGFIHSFNGPHSLFVDTVRTCRALVASHQLGHVLLGEVDAHISLLDRAMQHLRNTARYSIYYGKGRDAYDVRGRTAHECLFNVTSGAFRCPATQQGYSPFSTWTRGLAWAMLGFAEQLEFFNSLPQKQWRQYDTNGDFIATLRIAAQATCDFYIENTARDGIPYWDTGAPGLAHLGDWRARNAEPDNAHEPVDSSAAAIAAQGLLRLGKLLGAKGKRYTQAGLNVARTLFAPPYLSANPKHDGLLLHSVYHRPNGWDYIPRGRIIPQGESSMWGDYHALELAVFLQNLQRAKRSSVFSAAGAILGLR